MRATPRKRPEETKVNDGGMPLGCRVVVPNSGGVAYKLYGKTQIALDSCSEVPPQY